MPRSHPTEAEILRALAEGVFALGPLVLSLERAASAPGGAGEVDGVVVAQWREGKIHRRFALSVRAQWSQRSLDVALAQLRAASPLLPLVVFPYLADDHLVELERRGISGLDLCGNGVLYDPPHLFVRCSGSPPEFRRSATTPLVYQSRNIASLVPRVFLLQPAFTAVGAIQAACHRRMAGPEEGSQPLVLSTVSKALAQLEEDMVLARKGRARHLIDAERLLANLTRSFTTPTTTGHFLGKTALEPAELWRRLDALRPQVAAVVTGRGSAGHYTGLVGPERLQLYVSDLDAAERALDARPTQAFPNLELFETCDHAPYFDLRAQGGVLWASPIQTYLELAHGSAREIDTSHELQARLVQQAAGGGPT
ncbi:MAG: hypothetical protein R3B09_04670 [Nannocystaceae bacterium]